MRVLHVTDCYLPALGGIELLVSDLVSRQRAAGIDARVLTTEAGGGAADPAWVHRVPAGGRSALGRSLAGTTELADALDALRPDVVHAHVSVLSPFAVGAAAQAARTRRPAVVTAHSLWTSVPAPLPGLAGAGLQLGRWPVLWTAVSGAAAHSLRSLVGRDVPVRILPNAVDPDAWRIPAAERVDDGVRLVSVMRLARRKRPLPLARVLRRVRAALPPDRPLRAVIVGEGPLGPALAGYLDRHAMSGWVSLPGRLDRPAIRDVLAGATAFVTPAPLESFGIAALEARCAGVPVVASERSGVRDFIEPGRDGLLTRDDGDLARALTRLVVDAGLRERLIAGARSGVPDLGWERAVDRSRQVYAEAVALAARPTDPRGAVLGSPA